MATDAGSVSYSIDADTSGVLTGFDKTKKANDNLGRSFNKLDKDVSKSTLSLNKMARAIGGVIAAQQLWNATINASNVGSDFEASLADLSAITGATGDDLKFLSDEAKRLGSTTKFTASQVATSFKLMASAKPDLLENADALSQVTEQTLLLATASGVELTDAANTVGGALNQFGEEADQAARFVNVLAAGAKLGASEVTDTSEALKNAGVAAASAKISFEETNAAIQVLALSSIKGADAGTALRNIFLKLDTSADQDLRPSIVGLNKALENLEAQGLTSAEMVKMFGLENITAATALLNSRNKVDDLTTALTGTNVAAEQAAIKADTLKNSQLELASAIEGLQIAIAESANPALRSLVDLLTEATQGATFFWQSLNEGSTQNILSEMADVNDEITKLRANLAGEGGFFDSGLFYDDAARKQDEFNLAQAEARLAELRAEYKKNVGLTPPAAGGTSGQALSPTIPPIISPTPTFTDKESSSASANFVKGFGDELGDSDGGFATGISAAIIAENETLAEELERQRELILEFQELGIGDAEAHAQALIEIDKQQKQEQMRLQSEVLTATSGFFEASADLIGTFAGESSNAYKALFAVSKGFAIANAALQLQTAIANASALPFPANIPAIASAVTIGAGIASNISSLAYSGGRENGGPVSSGSLYQVGEGNKPEVLQTGSGLAMIPGDNGRVFNQNQLDQIGGGGGSMQVTQQISVTGTGDKDLIAAMGQAAERGALMAQQKFQTNMNDKNGPYYTATRQNYGTGTTNGRPT